MTQTAVDGERKTMEKLTNLEKFKLLGIDIGELQQEIQREISMTEMHKISDDALNEISDIIGESIELEVAAEEPLENTKASFLMKGGRVFVLKAKRLNIEQFFFLFIQAEQFLKGNELERIAIALYSIFKLFFQNMDEDLSRIYTYLAYEYFHNGRKFNNVEIFDAINRYLKESLDTSWANRIIDQKLIRLEKELRVIECVNGIYEVSDKIYFL